jgi:serine/threonine protein kinase
VAESNLNDFMAVAEKQTESRSMLSSFFGCLAGAVMYLHNNRIRHRDIKPENILIYQAKVYLTDFGISLDWEHLSRSTTTEDSGKTPLYCAPEVASQFAKRNSSTDIWSLGCVFVEMLVVVRNCTREELRTAFYNSSETRVFYRNSTVAHEWLNGRLLDGITVSGRRLTQITSAMLSLDPECRPKADTVYDTLSSWPSNNSPNATTYCGERCQSIEAAISETHSDDDAWDQDLHESVNTSYTTESPPASGQYVSPRQQPQQSPDYPKGPAGQVAAQQSSGVAHNHNSAPPVNPVFGVALNELYRRDGSFVPLVVYQCIQAVELFGLEVEGIYSMPGTWSHIQAMKALFNSDSDAAKVNFQNPIAFQHDIKSVAGLLRQFFYELPDPFLTRDLYTKFINAALIDDDTMRRNSMHVLINELPDHNYAILRAVVLHLFRVQQVSDVNHTDTAALGIYWA